MANQPNALPCATTPMTEDTPLPFDLPAVDRKKITVDFAGGNQSSDGGLLLLRQSEAQLGVCQRIANAMPDHRDQSRIEHQMSEIVMARVAAIACGYEDANDHDRLRHDPLMKIAVGRCPETGEPLASQPTISRLENAPRKTDAARLCAAMVDQFGATVKPSKSEILDIDDTFCAAHGGQPLAFWNAHHDERGFASMHIYHVESGTPVSAILRPVRTPKGTEVRTVIKHVTKQLRKNDHWLNTTITWRGDSHYGRVEAMEWAEDNGDHYIFGLAGNTTLDALTAKAADNLRFHHAVSGEDVHKLHLSGLQLGPAAQGGGAARMLVAAGHRGDHHHLKRHAPGGRHPLRRDFTQGFREVPLRGCLLQARADGEPDQAAQGAVGIRPDVVSQRDRQSGAARFPHRGVLVDARYTGRHSVGNG
jgi:Transposase DDE domain group 1